MTAQTAPSPATLLRLSERERAGLTWIKNRVRFWLTGLKRRRKYLPRGEPYSEEEAVLIRALAALEEAAGVLLDSGVVRPHRPGEGLSEQAKVGTHPRKSDTWRRP